MKNILFVFLLIVFSRCSKNDNSDAAPSANTLPAPTSDVSALVGTFKGDSYSGTGTHYAPCTLKVSMSSTTSVRLYFERGSPLSGDTLIANVSGGNITIVTRTIPYTSYYGNGTHTYSGSGTYTAPVLNMTITDSYNDPHSGTGNNIYTYAYTKQ